MGSDSDLKIMQAAADILNGMDISFDLTVVSAHRTPDRLHDYAQKAKNLGYQVIIAAAGGAAHLPGMVASVSPLPVIGVPIKSSNSMDGWDSVLSILQMPKGVPVATMTLDGAANAALYAVRILAIQDQSIATKLDLFMQNMKASVDQKIKNLSDQGFSSRYDD